MRLSLQLHQPFVALLFGVIAAGLAQPPDVHASSPDDSLHSADTTLRAKADSLRMAGDVHEAVKTYLQLLHRWGPEDDVAYAVASTFAVHGGYPDSVFKYLDMALPFEEAPRPLWDPDFYFLLDDPRWEDVEDRQLQKLSSRIGPAFNEPFARALLRIRMKEWGFRYHIMLAYRTLDPLSPILSALGFAMGEHHRANEKHLEQLLDEFGWPEISAVGEDAAYAAGNVINHSDLATRERYLPILKETCERGEADWSDYAHILDRTKLEKGNPQVYGTQMEVNEESGRYEPRPIVDPENVNSRREALGMEPIEVQLKRFNDSMERDFGRSEE